MVVIFYGDPNYDIKIIEKKKKISINIVNFQLYYLFAEHVLNDCNLLQQVNYSSVKVFRHLIYLALPLQVACDINVIISVLTSELMQGNYLNPSNDHVN